jgi:hypothetical protein
MNIVEYISNPKSIIFIILFSACFTVQSQLVITNPITEQHEKITGTNVSIIPPEGFSRSFVFAGFQQDRTGASIMVVNIPNTYEEPSLAFTKNKLKEDGLNVKQIEEMAINGIPAKFATTEQNIYGNIYTKYILILGNSDEIFFITGSYPKVFKGKVDFAIKNALLSTVIDSKVDEQLFYFSLNNDHSEFILQKREANVIQYNINSKHSKTDFECSLTVSRQMLEKPVEDKLGFSLKELNKYATKDVESIHSIEVAGLPGFEIIIKTDDNKLIYQQVLFEADDYYLFLGTINDNFEKNINEIRQLNQTFKLIK